MDNRSFTPAYSGEKSHSPALYLAFAGPELFSMTAPYEAPAFLRRIDGRAPPNKNFTICKLGIFIEVNCDGDRVWLTLGDPSIGSVHILRQIMRSEHFLAQSFLNLNQPQEPVAALVGYFERKGWEVSVR